MKRFETFESFDTNGLKEVEPNTFYIVPSYVNQPDDMTGDLIELVPGDILETGEIWEIEDEDSRYMKVRRELPFHVSFQCNEKTYVVRSTEFRTWFFSDVNDNSANDKWEIEYISPESRRKREEKVFRNFPGLKFGKLTREHAEKILFSRRGKIASKKFEF